MSCRSARRARVATLTVAAAVLATGALAPACGRRDPGRGGESALTSGNPRPDSTVPTTRTIDNAGFVDNGGRTSDETSRSEMSGMRATETGSERPTGTPGSGTPIPSVVKPPPTIGEGAGAASSERGTSARPSTGGPVSEAIPRLARACCDRETTCNRVGHGRELATQEACMSRQQDRVSGIARTLSCPRGIDNVQLGICLNAIRTQACDDRRGDLTVLPDCAQTALCAP